MSFDARKNFAYTTVATPPNPADTGTSLVVNAGDGALFAAPPFNATAWPPNVNPSAANAEIVRVTAISTDTFTITRHQEGSTARNISAGWQIMAGLTDKTLDDIESEITTHEANISNPHSVTKSQVGLGNVDNTSDTTKNSASVTITNHTFSGANNTFTSLPASAMPSLDYSAQSLSNPYKFSAYRTSSQATADGGGGTTIIFDTELFDSNNNYNNATGVYTVPITGYYFVSARAFITGVANSTIYWEGKVWLNQNGTTIDGDDFYTYNITQFSSWTGHVSNLYFFTAGDLITVVVWTDTQTNNAGNVSGGRMNTNFSAFLVSKT